MSVVSTSGGSLQLPPIPLRYSVPSADETTYVHFVTKGISTLDFDLAPSLRLLSHHFLKASFSKPLILLLFPEVALTKKLSYLQLCYLCVRHAFILPLQNWRLCRRRARWCKSKIQLASLCQLLLYSDLTVCFHPLILVAWSCHQIKMLGYQIEVLDFFAVAFLCFTLQPLKKFLNFFINVWFYRFTLKWIIGAYLRSPDSKAKNCRPCCSRWASSSCDKAISCRSHRSTKRCEFNARSYRGCKRAFKWCGEEWWSWLFCWETATESWIEYC